MGEHENVPEHYTRQPWWVILLGGAIASFLPFVLYCKLEPGGVIAIEIQPNWWQAMLLAGVLGVFASALMVLRSHIRSSFLAGVVMFLGIAVIVVGVCVAVIMLAGLR